MNDDVVELTLSRPVAATNTTFIRASVNERIEQDLLGGPPVELVHFHVFLHCTRGRGRHMVDFEDVELQPGMALWIRPGQVQRWSDVDDDFDADVTVFASSQIPDLPLFDVFAHGTTVAMLGSDSEPLRQQMQWLAADLEANADTAVAAAVVGVLLRIFARRAELNEPSNDPRRQLANAFVNSIDNNIGQRSVAWHAHQIGASSRSVARATTHSLKLSPKAVMDSRVILEAQRRLAWSEDGIAAIARSLEFTEASNFTKFFRSRTGTSPTEFRESLTSTASNLR